MTGTTCVRVVLPSDTVARVAVAPRSTAADLIAQLPVSKVGTLVLLRRGLDVRPNQRLCGLVHDGDVLEWRSDVGTPEDEPQQQGRFTRKASKRLRRPTLVLIRTGERLRRRRLMRTLRLPLCVMTPAQARHVPQPAVSPAKSQRRRPSASARRDSGLSRFLPKDFLLRAGLAFVDRLLSVQSLTRRLLLDVRSIKARLGPNPVRELFPVVQALAFHTSELLPREPLPSSVRWLYPLITRSVRGVEMPVVMRGYVEVAEWVALWRNQRTAYACLCDGAKLLFFTTKKQCDEYLLEKALRGDTAVIGANTESDHKRIIKDNAPQTVIDLVQNQWNVRRGEVSPSDTTKRHAFALFDKDGKLRLIFDVKTQREADLWISAIKNELQLSDLLDVKLQAIRKELHGLDLVHHGPQNDHCGETISHILGSNHFRVPLRRLHSLVDAGSGGRAREQRIKSLTLVQALKDARRDRIKINGELYSGQCVEEVVGALLMEINRHDATSETEALQFAYQLLIASSRTQGGGDILDAMQLLLNGTGTPGNEDDEFYLFPTEPGRMDPICIEIGASCGELVANIRMEMAYRVLSTSQPVGEETHLSPRPDRNTAPGELCLQGVYRRRLVCGSEQWNRLDGDVQVTILAPSRT